MSRRKIKRNALNRGTAVHLGGAKVRFIWACRCKHVQTIKSPLGPLSHDVVARLVRSWRTSGVALEQCKKHPDWYSKHSQIPALNAENPNQ